VLNEPIGSKTQGPYTPPASDTDGVAAVLLESAVHYGYRVRGWLLPTVVGSLGLQGLLHGLNATACLALASSFGDPKGLLWLSQSVVLVLPYLYYGGALVFGIFLVDANKNARAFVTADADTDLDPPQAWGDEPELWGDEPERADDDERPKLARAMSIWAFSPASMIWWHFVPVFNLFRPYQAVKAVWASSAPQHEGRSVLRGDLLFLWWAWAAWLGNLLASRVRTMKTFSSSFAAHDLKIALCDIVSAVACLLALRMVRVLSERQRLRAAELWTSSTSSSQ
jgi:hypothetical protein